MTRDDRLWTYIHAYNMGALVGLLIAAALGLTGCATPSSAPPSIGDAGACRDSCTHRIVVGCIDPDPEVSAQCVHACELATARGWYHPERVAVAPREDMAALGVRCAPR